MNAIEMEMNTIERDDCDDREMTVMIERHLHDFQVARFKCFKCSFDARCFSQTSLFLSNI